MRRSLRTLLIGRLLIGSLPVAAVIWSGLPSGARADVFSYGDFVGNTVKYVAVTETTDDAPAAATEGLFGVPIGVADSLDFNPVSFSSFAAGAGSTAEKASMLSVGIEALSGHTVDMLRFNEGGDYSLLGLGGSTTSASVTADFTIDIVEVDGNLLATPISLIASMDLTPSDGDYDLANDGPGPLVNGNWTGALDVDLTQALIDAGESFISGVTKVNVDLTNVLKVTSEDGTSALISKKDFGGTSISVVVPLPSSVAMGLLGVVGMALLGWKRRI